MSPIRDQVQGSFGNEVNMGYRIQLVEITEQPILLTNAASTSNVSHTEEKSDKALLWNQ